MSAGWLKGTFADPEESSGTAEGSLLGPMVSSILGPLVDSKGAFA